MTDSLQQAKQGNYCLKEASKLSFLTGYPSLLRPIAEARTVLVQWNVLLHQNKAECKPQTCHDQREAWHHHSRPNYVSLKPFWVSGKARIRPFSLLFLSTQMESQQWGPKVVPQARINPDKGFQNEFPKSSALQQVEGVRATHGLLLSATVKKKKVIHYTDWLFPQEHRRKPSWKSFWLTAQAPNLWTQQYLEAGSTDYLTPWRLP